MMGACRGTDGRFFLPGGRTIYINPVDFPCPGFALKYRFWCEKAATTVDFFVINFYYL